MRFRFTLSHAILGTLEVSEFDGWKDATLKLERHEEFHSLIEYFDGSFILYGNNGIVNGGIDFVKEVEQSFGLDETIVVDIDLTFDEISFSNVFNGQFKLSDLEEMPNNKMRIPIIRDDFWSKFIARLDTPVNLQSTLDLDDSAISPAESINLKLTSQTIRQVFDGNFLEGMFVIDSNGDDYLNNYIQIDTPDVVLDEIEEKFTIPNASNLELPVWIIEAKYAGEYIFDLRIEASENNNITPTDNLSGVASIYIQVNDDSPIAFTEVNHGGGGTNESTSYTYSDTLNLIAGDIIRIYALVTVAITGANRFYIWGVSNNAIAIHHSFEPPSQVENPSYFSIIAYTVFPQTNNAGFLIHDVGAAITDRIIGETDTFYSELLGSPLTTARQYENSGCAWNYGLLKGLQARQYTLEEKPFFKSFNQWWKGANPILNLSLMYDTVDGNPVIRVEDKAFQYLDQEPIVYVSNIRTITRKYDNERIFNKAEIGYTRWESEDISGIDDPQTKKTYSTRFQKVGKGIQLYSEWIAASLAIEKTRRTSREKSSDYKYDNETFIIALNPQLQEESPDVSPDVLNFIPELDENFSVITGLLNSDTKYNLKLTPARNFLRWQNFLQGALQPYIGSEFKFASGEGNYDMTSTMDVNGCLNEDYDGANLDEKGNIPVGIDLIHLPHLYEAEIPMEWSDYVLIRDNRRKPIGISLSDTDHVPMFIKTLEFKPVKGEATILMWAKEYLDLAVFPDTTPMQECQVPSDDCLDALTDELGNILTDELGVCITE